MRSLLALLLPLALLLVSIALPGRGQVRPGLSELVAGSDNAIWGKVVGTRSVESEATETEPARRFEVLVVEGESLFNGRPIRVELTLPSAAHRTKVGSELVAFYRWQEELAHELAGNRVVDGLYPSFRDASGRAVVRARRALAKNESLDSFGKRVAILYRDRS